MVIKLKNIKLKNINSYEAPYTLSIIAQHLLMVLRNIAYRLYNIFYVSSHKISSCVKLFFTYLALTILGLLVGTIAAIVGIGGGVLFVPILILIFGLNMKKAVGTSLLAVMITSISSFAAYIRQRKVLYKLGLILEAGSVPGAILGASFAKYAPEIVLKAMFVLFLFIMSIEIFCRGEKEQSNPDMEPQYKKNNLPQAFVLSLLAGFLSASLGIGGGVIKVPIMITTLGLPVHYAIGTSAFMIMITSTAGVIQHIYYGHVNFLFGGLLGVGALIGAQLGAKIALKMRPKKLRIVLGIVIILVALRMLGAIISM